MTGAKHITLRCVMENIGVFDVPVHPFHTYFASVLSCNTHAQFDELFIQHCAADVCCQDKVDDIRSRALCFEDAPMCSPSRYCRGSDRQQRKKSVHVGCLKSHDDPCCRRRCCNLDDLTRKRSNLRLHFMTSLVSVRCDEERELPADDHLINLMTNA